MRHEPVSVVILTKDEPADLAERLEGVLAQLAPDDELVLVTSNASAAELGARRAAERRAGRVRVHQFPVPVSAGEAREMAIDLASHDVLVFLGADAVAAPGWLEAMRAAIANADVAYGRELHSPAGRNAAAVARGLRFHRYERGDDALPETFATNVNAAYRRFCFDTLPPEEELPAADDQAFARRARLAGLRLVYAPDALVERTGSADLRGEWRRQLRVGAAHAVAGDVLGVPRLHLLWATLVGALGVAAIALSSLWLLALTLLAFFAPTLRRLASPVSRRYRPHELARGAALSPILDMAFIGSYVARRAFRRG